MNLVTDFDLDHFKIMMMMMMNEWMNEWIITVSYFVTQYISLFCHSVTSSLKPYLELIKKPNFPIIHTALPKDAPGCNPPNRWCSQLMKLFSPYLSECTSWRYVDLLLEWMNERKDALIARTHSWDSCYKHCAHTHAHKHTYTNYTYIHTYIHTCMHT